MEREIQFISQLNQFVEQGSSVPQTYEKAATLLPYYVMERVFSSLRSRRLPTDTCEPIELIGLMSYLTCLSLPFALPFKRPQQTDTVKKKIQKIFRNHGLKIEIQVNKDVVDFLDVTLDIRNCS